MTQLNEVEALIERLGRYKTWFAIGLGEQNEASKDILKLIALIRKLQAELSEARAKALEEAAILIEAGQEIINMKTNARSIEPRAHGNLMGIAYAYAIRALKSKETTPVAKPHGNSKERV